MLLIVEKNAYQINIDTIILEIRTRLCTIAEHNTLTTLRVREKSGVSQLKCLFTTNKTADWADFPSCSFHKHASSRDASIELVQQVQ